MRFQHILLFIVATVVCSFLSGCGGGSPTHDASQIEETVPPITFLHDHTAGLEIARQERKPTLIFFSVPDNAGSQRMMETTFRDEEIKRLAEWLVCIHVDGSQESVLCESLGISSFPTVILSNVNGTEVRRLVGRQTPDQLAVQIHILLQVMALRPQVVTGR
jgi:hypothetical protein